MVDKILIMNKLSKLELYIKQISEYQNISYEDYINNWKVQRIIERTLQIMIETCLDIAAHIISDKGFPSPISYSHMFKILIDNNILDKDRLDTYQKMARFRNILVHQYEDIDPSIILSIVKKNLKDFNYFRDSIIKFLKEEE